jgi:hypothetical protein
VGLFHGFNDVNEAKGKGCAKGGGHYLPHLLMNRTIVEQLQLLGLNSFHLDDVCGC